MEVDPFQLLGIQPGCDFAIITAAHAGYCQKYPDLRYLFDQALLELIGSPKATLTTLGEAEKPAPPPASSFKASSPSVGDSIPAPASSWQHVESVYLEIPPVPETQVVELKMDDPRRHPFPAQIRDAATFCRQGNLDQEKNRFQEALENYNQALACDAQHVGAYAGRGRLFAGPLRRADQALADFNRAIDLQPELPELYYLRGKVYADAPGEMGDPEKALADFSRAIALNGAFAGAYLERGTVYRRRNEQRKAMEDLTRALQLAPNSAPAHFQRGLACVDSGRHQDALSDFDSTIRSDPRHVLAYIERGRIRQQMKQLQTALEDFNQAIRLNPRMAQAYYNRGKLHAEMGKAQNSQKDLERAVQLEKRASVG
jgi:tetratricopeptide (TPR) repeat protein